MQVLCDADKCIWSDEEGTCTNTYVNFFVQNQGEEGCTLICDTFELESE